MSLSNSRLCLTFNLIVLVILARFTSAWNMASDETHKNDCYQKPSEDLTEDMISGAYLELHMGDHNHGDVCRISINNDFFCPKHCKKITTPPFCAAKKNLEVCRVREVGPEESASTTSLNILQHGKKARMNEKSKRKQNKNSHLRQKDSRTTSTTEQTKSSTSISSLFSSWPLSTQLSTPPSHTSKVPLVPLEGGLEEEGSQCQPKKPYAGLTKEMIAAAQLELHTGDHNHGDVCRIVTNNDFFCPKHCHRLRTAPFCASQESKLACRSTGEVMKRGTTLPLETKMQTKMPVPSPPPSFPPLAFSEARPSRSAATTTLVVSGLSEGISDREVVSLFDGLAAHVTMVSVSTALVTFRSANEAADAMSRFNRMKLPRARGHMHLAVFDEQAAEFIHLYKAARERRGRKFREQGQVGIHQWEFNN